MTIKTKDLLALELAGRLERRALAILSVRKVPTRIQRHDASLDNEAAARLRTLREERDGAESEARIHSDAADAYREALLAAEATITKQAQEIAARREADLMAAKRLDKMAREASSGGWSTIHVEPMREIAASLRARALANGETA